MKSQKRYYVYILASVSGVLYIGMTGFLMARVLQHKAAETPSFTQKYRLNRLVYFEAFQYVNNAIARETELKKWRRSRKVELIEKDNPTWVDLAADWGKPAVMKSRFLRSDVAAE
jgi:putative endonuclease